MNIINMNPGHYIITTCRYKKVLNTKQTYTYMNSLGDKMAA